MATVFSTPDDFQAYKPVQTSARAERADRRNSQGLTMMAPGAAAPVLTSTAQFSHYQPQRPAQTQGIENALSMSLEIPPFNPAKRKNAQQHATPAPSNSAAQQAYPSPLSVPRPAATSSQRSSISSTASGQPAQQETRSSNPTQSSNRPASAHIVPVPYTPEASSSSSRPEAATTGARTRADRNTTQIVQPHTTGHAVPAATQGMGIYQPPPSTSNSGRPKIFFGPYQLLQTLGEGEFGKVKLGVRGDARWGEEVAIKLIKRGSVQESAARMTKVVREIDVLKVVKHPNIVRLHDVIETERYIGIVLEYASGGELFDHILAHRYLKDRDASKLFAQLISGVAYLHAKKIIHRDLKLENLLLDRNRNIIITDFGFANRFEGKEDDLMATSCGSPCYAAPELVVQDGKYVGSAVDVWSCGVILYAMLAGYLPFDDDPLNPDSENINLLYKYIMNTPLSFPEWITPEPRDLLQRMLVPDPAQRCTLKDVAQHRWLRKYVALFDRSVDDLENMVAEQDALKKQVLERQRDAVLHQEQTMHMTRSQTSSGMRPQSAMVSSATQQPLYAASAGASSPTRPGPSAASSNRRAHAHSAIVVPTLATRSEVAETDPFALSNDRLSATPMSVSVSAPSRSDVAADEEQQLLVSQQERKRVPSGDQEMPKAKSQRVSLPDDAEERERERKNKAKANRYTVQVEYVPAPDSLPSATSAQAVPMETLAESSPALQYQEVLTPSAESATEESFAPEASTVVMPSASRRQDSDSPVHSEFGPPESIASSAVADMGHSSANLNPVVIPLPTIASPSKSQSTPPASPARKTVPFPPSPERERSRPLTAPGLHEQVKRTASNTSRPPSSASTTSKHKKAGSSDRFSLSRFLGSNSSLDKHAKRAPQEQATDAEALDEVTNGKRKGARRKAFSLVVEPFKPSSSSSTRTAKRSSAQQSNYGSVSSRPPADRPRTRSSVALETTPVQGVSASVRSNATKATSTRREPSQASTTMTADPRIAQPPGKAKRVMDWFRWRSMPRDSALAASQGPAAPLTDFDRLNSQPASERVTRASVARQEIARKEEEAKAASVKEPAQIQPPQVTAPVVQAAPVSVAPAPQKSDAVAVSSSTVQRAPSAGSTMTLSSQPFNEARLRFHQGAVDQNALTYKVPPAVLLEIQKVLWGMGIDVQEEVGPFRLKCTRRSSRKVAATHGVSVNAVQSGSLASSMGGMNASSIGSAGNERLDGRTGLPASPSMGLTPSPSSTFKAFFGRRSSTTSVQTLGYPSPALSASTNTHDSPDLLLSPLGRSVPAFGTPPLPYYGKTDSGAEVRFTVEISRMKNLPKLYAVDIRRLKGELWAYRGIYNTLLERLSLGE